MCPLRWVCRVGYENWSWLISTRTLNKCFTHGVHHNVMIQQVWFEPTSLDKPTRKFWLYMANVIHVFIAEPTATRIKQNMFLQFPFKQNIVCLPPIKKRDAWKIFHPCRKKHRFSHLWDLDFWSLTEMCVWPMFESNMLMISTRNRFSNPSLIWCFTSFSCMIFSWSKLINLTVCRDPTLISVTVPKVHHSCNPRNVTIPLARQFVLRCVATFGNCLRWKLHG